MQEIRLARSLAFARAGNNIAAKMAIMAITTSNSIKVNPLGLLAETMEGDVAARAAENPRLIVEGFMK